MDMQKLATIPKNRSDKEKSIEELETIKEISIFLKENMEICYTYIPELLEKENTFFYKDIYDPYEAFFSENSFEARLFLDDSVLKNSILIFKDIDPVGEERLLFLNTLMDKQFLQLITVERNWNQWFLGESGNKKKYYLFFPQKKFKTCSEAIGETFSSMLEYVKGNKDAKY